MSTAINDLNVKLDRKQRAWLQKVSAALDTQPAGDDPEEIPLTGVFPEVLWEQREPAFKEADGMVCELEDAELDKAPQFRKAVNTVGDLAEQRKFSQALKLFDVLEPKIKAEFEKLQKSRGGGVCLPERDGKQTQKLSITVTDGATNNAIAGAVVAVEKQQEKTGNTGYASLLLSPGKYTYAVTAEGYEQAKGSLEVKDQESKLLVELKAVAGAACGEPPPEEKSADPQAAQYQTQVLKVGSCGPAVECLQTLLNKQGASLGVDGKFGPATQQAVKCFQSSRGLAADGIVGRQTWTALAGGGGGSCEPPKSKDKCPPQPCPCPGPQPKPQPKPMPGKNSSNSGSSSKSNSSSSSSSNSSSSSTATNTNTTNVYVNGGPGGDGGKKCEDEAVNNANVILMLNFQGFEDVFPMRPVIRGVWGNLTQASNGAADGIPCAPPRSGCVRYECKHINGAGSLELCVQLADTASTTLVGNAKFQPDNKNKQAWLTVTPNFKDVQIEESDASEAKKQAAIKMKPSIKVEVPIEFFKIIGGQEVEVGGGFEKTDRKSKTTKYTVRVPLGSITIK